MTRKDSSNALTAARRAYPPPATQYDQTRPPNNFRHSQPPDVTSEGHAQDQRLPGDHKNQSSSSTHASRSTTAASATMLPERSAHTPKLSTRSPLEHVTKPNNPFSDDAEVTVVESEGDSDSDDAGEGEPFSPEAMRSLDPSDLIFMVMGVTGAGKSTFISLLTEEDVEVGHQLQSSTKQVSFYELGRSISQRVWLIDTPGFDDTERENLDLLKELIACLTLLDKRGGHIAGIFYLHRITDPRMSGSALKSLSIFKLLVGARAMPLVRLVSTRWHDVKASPADMAKAEAVEKQLCTSEKFWGSCIADGALVLRHQGDQASAEAVIDSVLENSKSPNPRLSIVQELHDKRLPLLETGVGRFIGEDTDKLAQQYEVDIANLKRDQKAALEDKDHELAQQLAEEEAEFQRRSKQIAKVKNELNIPYVPPHSSPPRHRATGGSSKSSKRFVKSKGSSPQPPPRQQSSAPRQSDEMLARLSQMHDRERLAMEKQLRHEKKKNRQEKRKRSHGSKGFFDFLLNS